MGYASQRFAGIMKLYLGQHICLEKGKKARK